MVSKEGSPCISRSANTANATESAGAFYSFKSDERTLIYRFKKNRQIIFAGAIQTCRLGTANSAQLVNQLAAAILLIVLVIDELHVGDQLIHGLLRQIDDLDAHLGQLSLVCLSLSGVVFHHHCSVLGEDVNQNFLILSRQGLELSLVHADDVQGADVVGLGVDISDHLLLEARYTGSFARSLNYFEGREFESRSKWVTLSIGYMF